MSAESYRAKYPDLVRQWPEAVRRAGVELVIGLDEDGERRPPMTLPR